MQYNDTKHINHNIKAIKDYHIHNWNLIIYKTEPHGF